MNQKIGRSAETVWGVLIAAAVVFLLFIAYLPQKETLFSSCENMDWPRYLLWPLLALSLFLAGKGILREQSVRREQSLRREGHRLSRFRGPLALAGICIVCFSLTNVVGFLPFADRKSKRLNSSH